MTKFLTSFKKGIMKLNIHKFTNLYEFLPSPISNHFRKGKIMKLANSLMTILIATTFAISGCMQQESEEMQTSDFNQYSNLDPSEGDEQDTLLEVNLGGASRAERFLGSYDEIERLALDVVRNYGNKQVVTDLVLTQEGGIWKGTVPKLIVGFDYTITGHAYRPYDNVSDSWTTGKVAEPHSSGNKWLEIFQGQAQHPVVEGTNTLSLRLAPILDDRDLSVPRITRIQRPFQLGTNETSSIEVRVDTVGNGSDDDLSWRFRPVDNQSLPVTDGSRGTFSPDSGDNLSHTSGIYPYITSDYTAPDNSSPCFNDGTEQGQCPQKLQVRVSNLQEIGVSAHFTVYVTDNETAVTTVDNNPVITSISAERVGPNQLQWTIEVSDDDPFDSLDVHWDYLFGATRNFTDNSTDNLTYNTGRMQTVMEYSDTDDGMLLVTVCETDEGEGACQYQNESSTSVEYMLIPHAFPEIVACDDTGCELPNRIAGTRLSPKKWFSCFEDQKENNGHDMMMTFSLTPKDFEFTKEAYDSKGATCNGNLKFVNKTEGSAQQNSASAFVYPTVSFIDGETGDNVSVYEVKFQITSNNRTLHDHGLITSYNDNNTCGYNANDWSDNRTLDVSGCSELNEGNIGDNLSVIFHHDLDNNTLRFAGNDNGTYPRDLDCIEFSDDRNNPGDAHLCNNSSSSGSSSSSSSGSSHDLGVFLLMSDSGKMAVHDGDNNTSVNFQTWSGSNEGTFQDMAYGNQKFVAARQNSGLYESYDNLSSSMNWTRVINDSSNYKVEYGGGNFIAFRDNIIRCSNDNYTESHLSNFTNASILSAAYGDGKWVVVGGVGKVAYSNDCMNWTAGPTVGTTQWDLLKVVYGKDHFLAFNESDHKYFYANNNKITDNQTIIDIGWEEESTDFKISDVTFVDNEFIALYDSSKIAMTNGYDNMTFGSWSQINGLSHDLKYIEGGNSKMLGMADGQIFKLFIGSKSNLSGSWFTKDGLSSKIDSIHRF